MVRCLLYSAGISEKFWSAALVHVLYLKPGKRPSKADRHTAHGVLLGFGSAPKPMNEFTAALATVDVSLTSSHTTRSDGITVTFSTDPFGPPFSDTIIYVHYDTDRNKCQITRIDPGIPAHHLPQWRSRLYHAFLRSIDQSHVHTSVDALQAISNVRQLDNITVGFALTKDDAPYCLSAVSLPKLYSDQLQVINRHIFHAALEVVHKAATRPKVNRRHLQQQLNWDELQDAEWITIDNYQKKNLFGPPCTMPIDASMFFCVWLYIITPHENN
jgi:hypothetical protein